MLKMASENETVEAAINRLKHRFDCPNDTKEPIKGEWCGACREICTADGKNWCDRNSYLNDVVAIESAWRRERKPKRNCDRFATAEEAYNACPQFCDIDVKTMSDRELKIVEATIRGLEWIFATCEEGGAEGFKIAEGEVVKEGQLDDETSKTILKATVEMLAQYMSAKTSGEKVRFRVPTENGPVLITAEKEIAE